MNKRTVKRLEDDLLLMKASREQYRNELAICVSALAAICGEEYMSRKTMAEHARQALVNIGALAAEPTLEGGMTGTELLNKTEALIKKLRK